MNFRSGPLGSGTVGSARVGSGLALWGPLRYGGDIYVKK